MTTANQKAPAKKRGGYNFSNTPAASASEATKTVKKVAKKNRASAKKVARKASASTKKNIDLGLASISRSASTMNRAASNASRQASNAASSTASQGSRVLDGAFARASNNAQQFQDKFSGYGRELSNKMAQASSKAAQNASKSLEIHRDAAEAMAQSYHSTSEAAKKSSQQMLNFMNGLFAQNVEAARAALACRNVAEFFELQNKTARQNIESTMEQAIKMSEMGLKTATQAIEPLNETVAKNSRKLSEFVA